MNPLNKPKRVNETTSLHASYSDQYYTDQNKGFTATKRKASARDNDDETDHEDLEYDEGYAIADRGEAPVKEVTFSRPKSPKKRKVYPDAYDIEGIAEFARCLDFREAKVARRAQAEAWRELSLTLRSVARD